MLCRYKCRLHSASGFVDREGSKSLGDVCGAKCVGVASVPALSNSAVIIFFNLCPQTKFIFSE